MQKVHLSPRKSQKLPINKPILFFPTFTVLQVKLVTLCKQNVGASFKSLNKIADVLFLLKDTRHSPSHKRMYKILPDCSSVYIGKTTRSTQISFKEHHRYSNINHHTQYSQNIFFTWVVKFMWIKHSL